MENEAADNVKNYKAYLWDEDKEIENIKRLLEHGDKVQLMNPLALFMSHKHRHTSTQTDF